MVDTTKRYYYEAAALTSLKNELERKFLLRGTKKVEILFIIYTKNIPFYKNMLSEDLNIWIVDLDYNRLLIYENQPEDFLDLKSEIEASLKEDLPKKKAFYPFTTAGLIAINAFVFFMMYLFGTNSELFMELGANCWSDVFIGNEYYRLLTCMFIHSGTDHFINNMISLALIGHETEKRFGHVQYFVLYMISGLSSSLASALYYMSVSNATNSLVYSVGASGAIFGIYGAYIVLTLFSNKKLGRPISVSRVVIVTFLLLYSGFTGENIDNMAHLSGLIVGIIISFIYCKCDKSILKY